MELLERELGRLEGVRTAKVRGPTDADLFYYRLDILESKPLLPSRLEKLAERLEEFPFVEMIVSIPGTVERSGGRFELKARGSGLTYILEPNEALRKRLSEGPDGKAQFTVKGTLTEKGAPARPVLAVTGFEKPKN